MNVEIKIDINESANRNIALTTLSGLLKEHVNLSISNIEKNTGMGLCVIQSPYNFMWTTGLGAIIKVVPVASYFCIYGIGKRQDIPWDFVTNGTLSGAELFESLMPLGQLEYKYFECSSIDLKPWDTTEE